MTHKLYLPAILACLSVILSFNSLSAQAPQSKADSPKHCESTVNYPEKLVHDFPNIYNDTAYTGEDYNVVVRAVWMSQRGRKTKVTSPDQLTENTHENCVKFTAFNEIQSKNGVQEKYSVYKAEQSAD